MSEGVIDKPAHRIYHGIANDTGAGLKTRIVVMDSGDGPTQRKRTTELYQLTPENRSGGAMDRQKVVGRHPQA